MKTYVKPAMMALSISANDMLCTSCDIKTRDSEDYFIGILTKKYGGSDGLLDPSDNVFTSEENCTNMADDLLPDTYCKFSAVGGMIFTS